MISVVLLLPDGTHRHALLPGVPRYTDHVVVDGTEYVVGGVRWHVKPAVSIVEVHLTVV